MGAAGRRPARLQGRDLPVAAQVHRRAVDARACWWRGASCSPTGCPTCPAAAPSPTSTPTDHAYLDDPRAPRGGRHARRSSRRSAPGWSSSSRRPSASRRSGAPRSGSSSARSRRGARSRRSRSSATSTPTGCRSSRSSCASPSGRYLHHNFVVSLLNDLFGIQSRGGCSCAGPYGHRLLGIDLERSPRVRARDHRRLRGHQARLGAGELQLLPLRHRRRLHHRRRAAGRARRLAAARGLPVRHRRPAAGTHRDGLVEPPISLRAISYDERRRARCRANG